MKKNLLMSLAACGGLQAEVAVTIYNQNLAVVRDTVDIDLQPGDSVINYDRATAQVIPDSVVLRDPSGKASFLLREQSYRNDPVSQGLLLSLFEGQEISFQQANPNFAPIRGKIVRSGYLLGQPHPKFARDRDFRRASILAPGPTYFPVLGRQFHSATHSLLDFGSRGSDQL